MNKRIDQRTPFNFFPVLILTLAACGADVTTEASAQPAFGEGEASAEREIIILPGDERLSVPEFEPYEVEYDSAFGRFFNQVRKFKGDDGKKISVLNIIEMPQGVIVDHRTIDADSLRIETFNSPYFAWGPEFVFMRAEADSYNLVRVPVAGGEPIHTTGVLDNNGYFDGLGFSPTMAAILPLAVGTKFKMPKDEPRKDGSVASVLTSFEVTGRENLELPSGVSCECWVIQESSKGGTIHKYWISREAPFLIRRHRDVGGKRDFVSGVISFNPL